VNKPLPCSVWNLNEERKLTERKQTVWGIWNWNWTRRRPHLSFKKSPCVSSYL
jgi:hypothetical protein